MPNSLLLVAACVLALLLCCGPGVALASVENVEHGYEITFGESISAWATIESDVNVVEARLVYRPEGAGRIATYSYATIVNAPGHARVEGVIPTSGGAYLPPGTRLNVHFEIEFADESTWTVGPFDVLYLDPAHPWMSASSDGLPVDLHYYGISEAAARSLLDEAESRLPRVAQSLGVAYEQLPRWVAILYPSIGAFTETFPPTSQTATDNRLFGGFAMGEYYLLVQVSPSVTRFIHELTHLVIDHATAAPLAAPVPSWLHEGLAGYFESESSNSADQFIRQVDPSRIKRFTAMNTMPGRSEEIAVFYPQSASFVGFLLEEYGAEGMANTLAAINAGQRIGEALRTAYGRSLLELENDWRVSLGIPAIPLEATAIAPSAVAATPVPTPTGVTTIAVQTAAPPASDEPDAGSRSVALLATLIGSAVMLTIAWLVFTRIRAPHR